MFIPSLRATPANSTTTPWTRFGKTAWWTLSSPIRFIILTTRLMKKTQHGSRLRGIPPSLSRYHVGGEEGRVTGPRRRCKRKGGREVTIMAGDLDGMCQACSPVLIGLVYAAWAVILISGSLEILERDNVMISALGSKMLV